MLKLKEVEEIIQNVYNDSVNYCINHDCIVCDKECKKYPLMFAIENILKALEYHKILVNPNYQYFRDVFFAHGVDALIIEIYKEYQEVQEVKDKIYYNSLHIDNDMPYRWMYENETNGRIYELWIKLHLSAYILKKVVCTEFHSLRLFYEWLQEQENYNAFIESTEETWILESDYSLLNVDNTFLNIYVPQEETVINSIIGIAVDSQLPFYIFDSLNDTKRGGFMPKFVKECVDKKRGQYMGYKWYNLEVREL